MQYKIKIPIGDWSDDGHGHCTIFKIKSNYSVKILQEAYKASCKLTGVQFNDNENYTGLNLEDGNGHQICTEYEDNSIPDQLLKVLEKYNYDKEDLKWCKKYKYFRNKDHFVEILLWFIGLSTPKDWVYKKEEDEGEYLNGFWNNDLNVQFGYGLF